MWVAAEAVVEAAMVQAPPGDDEAAMPLRLSPATTNLRLDPHPAVQPPILAPDLYLVVLLLMQALVATLANDAGSLLFCRTALPPEGLDARAVRLLVQAGTKPQALPSST